MTREDALYYAEAYERTDGVPAKGLINDIYDDFKEELKKAYIEGGNDAWKARDKSIEKAIISVEDDYRWIAYEDKQNCVEILYELRGH